MMFKNWICEWGGIFWLKKLHNFRIIPATFESPCMKNCSFQCIIPMSVHLKSGFHQHRLALVTWLLHRYLRVAMSSTLECQGEMQRNHVFYKTNSAQVGGVIHSFNLWLSVDQTRQSIVPCIFTHVRPPEDINGERIFLKDGTSQDDAEKNSLAVIRIAVSRWVANGYRRSKLLQPCYFVQLIQNAIMFKFKYVQFFTGMPFLRSCKLHKSCFRY